ncbi:carboxypeptidase-like regulatory domain-containing protein [Zavarzinella formosa]|uniref:carboxypeptidase-like regulatory domain-containing protein n=1 Tax=Zavarzinella formosa TaxID=360055 RepID=UPI0002E253A2|nr:carboxypeptidase-like regulatory domain-containing protein [Zavarzinella formosa]
MIRPALAVVLLGLLTHSSAHAHKMLATCRLTETEVLVEVYYEDDSPADGAKIQIRQGDAVLVEGRTDDTGKWTALRLASGEYVLRAEHYGHVVLEPFTVPDSNLKPEETPLKREPAGVRWARIGVGIGVIVGFFAAIWVVCREKNTQGRNQSAPAP